MFGGAAITGLSVVTSLATTGCDDKPATNIAPVSSALAAPKPAPMGALEFSVGRETSKVEFLMDAPQEKIRGRAPRSATGTLQIDMDDITKSTGLLTIDLRDLEILQTKADGDGKLGEETRNETQNKHARTWLEISDDTPEDVRERNSKVQFSVKSIEAKREKSVLALTGSDRAIEVTAVGELLLHGHKATKSASLLLTFHFEGAKPVSVAVKTQKPVGVDLAEFDVKPRDAFGKLAAKTLDALSPKVNKEAAVSFELSAHASGPSTAPSAKTP